MGDEHPVLENMRRYLDAMTAGDMSVLTELVSDDHRWEDRRTGMRMVLDKQGNLQQARVMADHAKEHGLEVDLDLVEARGDRIALIRQVHRTAGYVIPLLVVMQVDADGRASVFVVFDEDDLSGAGAELDALERSR